MPYTRFGASKQYGRAVEFLKWTLWTPVNGVSSEKVSQNLTITVKHAIWVSTKTGNHRSQWPRTMTLGLMDKVIVNVLLSIRIVLRIFLHIYSVTMDAQLQHLNLQQKQYLWMIHGTKTTQSYRTSTSLIQDMRELIHMSTPVPTSFQLSSNVNQLQLILRTFTHAKHRNWQLSPRYDNIIIDQEYAQHIVPYG